MHKLSDLQYTWAALTARSKRSAWKDCESLVVTKGWLGGRKAKADPTQVIRLLSREGAPPDVLQTFLTLVEDAEERESLARRHEVPNVVIDCLVQARDRIGLESFKAKLTSHSQEWFYADHALNTTNTKWKN